MQQEDTGLGDSGSGGGTGILRYIACFHGCGAIGKKAAGRGGCVKSPDIVERKWVRAVLGGGNGSEEGERKALFYEVREKYTLCC